jgi:hypothetical protein
LLDAGQQAQRAFPFAVIIELVNEVTVLRRVRTRREKQTVRGLAVATRPTRLPPTRRRATLDAALATLHPDVVELIPVIL